MAWLLPRLIALLLGTLAGALLGGWLGQWVHAPRLFTVLGAAIGVAALGFFDTLQGSRLMAWLRDPGARKMPRGSGLWGELTALIERSLRARERQTLAERQRLEQFLEAVNASPNGILILDPNDQIVWLSAVAADHFGLDPTRDLMQRVTNLVRVPAFVQYLQSHQYGEPVKFDNVRAQGTLQVQVHAYGEGMKLVLSQDVTERERAEHMRRDFVANVSHEIRTPLTVLAGFIESFSHLELSTRERKRVLELMGQQTQRMQALVDDLLTLAKLEGSPRPPVDHWIAVGQLLDRVKGDALSVSAGRHEITVSSEGRCPADQTLLAGSQSEVLSAMNNLVQNAIRYTPDAGRITVSWAVLNDGQGEFSVQDTGVGIAPEHLPRLTERFYRVDSSRTRDTGGTGLGLSIVKHVLQRHGGELRIASEPGKGSRFTLIFPASRIKVGAPKIVETPPPSVGVH